MDNNQTNQYGESTSPKDSLNVDSYVLKTSSTHKKLKKSFIISVIVGSIVFLGIIIALIFYSNSDTYKYEKAKNLLAEKKYDDAISLFLELGNYENSENKIIECNRKKLYDYLVKSNGVYVTSNQNTYNYVPYIIGLEASSGNIELVSMYDDLHFNLTFDMYSDKGYFCAQFSDKSSFTYRTEGSCALSELKESGNSLEIDSYSDYSSNMQSRTNSSCDIACIKFDDLIEKTGLGLTLADIGFTNIK